MYEGARELRESIPDEARAKLWVLRVEVGRWEQRVGAELQEHLVALAGLTAHMQSLLPGDQSPLEYLLPFSLTQLISR